MCGLHATQSSKELLGVVELADFLGISQASVYRMVERREIRFYKLSRYLRFRREDVEAYLECRVVKPIEEHL